MYNGDLQYPQGSGPRMTAVCNNLKAIALCQQGSWTMDYESSRASVTISMRRLLPLPIYVVAFPKML